jgi:hypothetical protein
MLDRLNSSGTAGVKRRHADGVKLEVDCANVAGGQLQWGAGVNV